MLSITTYPFSLVVFIIPKNHKITIPEFLRNTGFTYQQTEDTVAAFKRQWNVMASSSYFFQHYNYTLCYLILL